MSLITETWHLHESMEHLNLNLILLHLKLPTEFFKKIPKRY